LQLQHFVGEAR